MENRSHLFARKMQMVTKEFREELREGVGERSRSMGTQDNQESPEFAYRPVPSKVE